MKYVTIVWMKCERKSLIKEDVFKQSTTPIQHTDIIFIPDMNL